MKTIIAATDFSLAGTNAANYAAEMASAIKADLLLVNVVDFPIGIAEIPTIQTHEKIIQESENNLNYLKEELRRKASNALNIETKVEEGTFFYCLKTACDKINPYAIVIGMRGKSELEKLFFGTNAAHVMKHLHYPVIAVPPNAKFSMVRKIGLACDFQRVTDTIPVEEIKMLVNDLRAELHVLNIGKSHRYNPEIVFQSGLLGEMLKSLKPEVHFLSSDHVDEGIVDFAEIYKIDLLIVLPKRRDIVSRIIHRSHTTQFILHSEIPLMALHE